VYVDGERLEDADAREKGSTTHDEPDVVRNEIAVLDTRSRQLAA
jgi:hypothetical protein